MLDIFSGLRLVVKRRNINIDNAIFRCHWFFTSTLLVSFSLIITARQYVGQPIECHSTDKIPDSLLNSYCWVQSTFTVPQACNEQRYGVDVPYPCIDNTRGREVKIYAYYQWVGIVLFIQGLLFHLPYYLWKLWENGLIKAITGGLRVAVLNEQERLKKKDIVVEYIHDHLGCHKRYAFKYFLCEFICLINLFGQLWATNKFFDGQFLRYGIEVMQYSTASSETFISNPISKSLSLSSKQQVPSSSLYQKQQSTTNNNNNNSSIPNYIDNNNNNNYNDNDNNSHSNIISLLASNNNNRHQSHYHQTYQSINNKYQQVDPMTFVFPRMTKCTYYDFGSSGDVQKHDALCLLPLNIINEKLYIALWFWFFILAILTIIVIIYRLFAIISESVRCKGLISRCKLSCERDIRLICRHCDVGDWFLFYMVAENLDPLIMREIVSAIASKINEHLELKRELRAQLEREERENNSNSTATMTQTTRRCEESDLAKLRLIMSNAGAQMGPQNSYILPPPPPLSPPPPPPPPSLPMSSMMPSAPPASISRQDSSDSEYVAPSSSGASFFGGASGSRRNSFVDQVPFVVKKIKKRLYNKRLWSIDLGPGEQRQQMMTQLAEGIAVSGSAETSAATITSSSTAQNQHHEHIHFTAQSQFDLGSSGSSQALMRRPQVASRLLQRRGSLNSQSGAAAAARLQQLENHRPAASSTRAKDFYIMEMDDANSTSAATGFGATLYGSTSRLNQLGKLFWATRNAPQPARMDTFSSRSSTSHSHHA